MMDKTEKKEFIELVDYVKNEILKYDSNVKTTKFLVLRLQGLRSGQYLKNNKNKEGEKYSYKVILNTFKCCKLDIELVLQKTKFTNEQHKINTIIKIVSNDLDRIYNLMKERNMI